MSDQSSTATELAAAGIGAITLFVDDLQATKQLSLDVAGKPLVFEDEESAVLTFGDTLLDGPMDPPWRIRTASFRDPAGHIWEIAR